MSFEEILSTQKETDHPERRKMIEVKIPTELQQHLKAGAERITQKIRGFKPDVVVVLERSAPIPFAAMRKHVECPIVQADIGREVSAAFQGWLEPEMGAKGVDIYTGGFEMEKYLDEFETWLETSSLGQRLVENLTQKLQDMKTPEKVLIIDDTYQSGATIEVMAPAVVRQALDKLGITEAQIQGETIFQGYDWTVAILKETFGTLSEPKEWFLRELLKGSQDIEGSPAQSIQTAEDLATLGRATKKVKGQDPYETLHKQYGDEVLLELPKKVQTQLKDITPQ